MTDENQFRRVQWDGDEPLPSDDDGPDGMPLSPRGAGLSAEDLGLLTLAARALGATVEVVDGEQWVNLHFEGQPPAFGWNPLLHSDDTLNVAVTLGIEIFPDRTVGETSTAFTIDSCGYNTFEQWSEHRADPVAATRRAVTRAAAEIGKAMA